MKYKFRIYADRFGGYVFYEVVGGKEVWPTDLFWSFDTSSVEGIKKDIQRLVESRRPPRLVEEFEIEG